MSNNVLVKILLYSLGVLSLFVLLYAWRNHIYCLNNQCISFFSFGVNVFYKNLSLFYLIVFWAGIDLIYIFYRVFLLYIHKRKFSMYQHPLVSVLIPAYNEGICIDKTLSSCLNQTYPNLELIVINDGSTDDTLQVVNAFKEQNASYLQIRKINIKVIDQVNQGKAKALNSGKAEASGDFLITIDADSYLNAHAIEKIMVYFDKEDVGAVAGNVVALYQDSVLGYLQKIEYDLGVYFIRGSQSTLGNVIVTPGALSAYRKNALKKFEEGTLTEDFDSSIRILENGYKIIMAADAICYTQVPLGISDLIKQRIRWQQGSLEVFSKHSFHRKNFLVSIEWTLLFMFGFYSLFSKFIAFFAVPFFLFAGNYSALLFFVFSFFIYSVLSYGILFSIVAHYSNDEKSLLAIPLFVVYFNTIVLYSVLVAQILTFKGKDQSWGKIKRYHI
ncbi:MAG: glycosyltransferase [Candidatus Paceibacterota bacterium]